MKKLVNMILDIFFPKRCVFCGRKLDTEYKICLCDECSKKAYIKYVSPRQFEKKFFEKMVCCMYYKGIPRKRFLKFKFSNLKFYKDTYAAMIYNKIKDDNDYMTSFCITSVPLSKERLKMRGYNQSGIIAESLASLTNISYFDDMLIKIKDTKPFNKLTAKMRRKLVRGSYIFNENYDITGKDIILIDDIYTTGATINECSKILKMYGANAVYCASVFSSEFDK